mgnify:CR=1 FL=1
MSLLRVVESDITEAVSCYQPIFERVLRFPYFDPNYKVLERKVSVDWSATSSRSGSSVKVP